LTRSTSTSAPAAPSLGELAAPGAQSSSYTCGGLGEGAGPSHGVIIVANGTSQGRHLSFSVIDDKGHSASSLLELKAAATRTFDPSTVVSGGSWVAATVSISGGGVAVVEQLTTSNSSATPCAAATASTWDFVGGSTQVNQSYELSLVNPTATSAVVDTSFLTDGGLVAPQDAQGLVVVPHGLVVLSGLALVPHSSDLGAVVKARQGSIVAFASQLAPSPAGASVTVGQPSRERSLVLARGLASKSAKGAIVIGNPSNQAQRVVVRLRLPSGAVSPQRHVIAPYSSYLEITDPSTRIPQGGVYAASIQSSGPGIVASLSTQVTGAGAGGWGNAVLTTPSSMAARHWMLVGGLGKAPLGASVTNMGRQPVTLHAVQVGSSSTQAVPGLDGLKVAAGSSLSLSTAVLSGLSLHSLELSASGPLAISEDLAGGAAPSVGNLIALAIAGP
jgi:hypothetical protein